MPHLTLFGAIVKTTCLSNKGYFSQNLSRLATLNQHSNKYYSDHTGPVKSSGHCNRQNSTPESSGILQSCKHYSHFQLHSILNVWCGSHRLFYILCTQTLLISELDTRLAYQLMNFSAAIHTKFHVLSTQSRKKFFVKLAATIFQPKLH